MIGRLSLVSAVALAVLSVRGDDAALPLCALRFGYRYTQPDKWPEMRAALAKNRAFDEVWFSTGITFPKLAWHEEHARQCAVAAADLRKLGIVPSIEIQTIIGHGDAGLAAGDCSGQDWGTMVSCEGLAARHLSCPRDPRLAAYFARVAELHAAWKPGSLWIDDDMSYRNRAPVIRSSPLPGCFCDRCLGGFVAREGRDWTRADLAAAIRTDAAVRARWDAYSVEGMGALARAIAAAVRRVSPETVLGYQYGGAVQKAIPYGLYEGSGHPVRVRPGAGAYWDTDAYLQLEKAYGLQGMMSVWPKEPWVGACCPEIESCPRTFACRTPQGLILEAFENLALGMDFVSLFAADARGDESTAFYADRLFPRLTAARPFLTAYREANAGTLPTGFSYADNAPPRLVAARGVPIIGGYGRSLGTLPAVTAIPARTAGADWLAGRASKETVVMQVVSSVALTNYYATCDRACGGRLPVLFDEAEMSFVMPRTRSDGTLATVAFVNMSIDRQDPVGVRLRGVGKNVRCAVWHEPESAPVNLPFERKGDEIRVRLPRLCAWGCGFLGFQEERP